MAESTTPNKLKNKYGVRAKLYLLNRLIDEAIAGTLTKHTYSTRLNADHLYVMGVDAIEDPKTHHEQTVAGLFSKRKTIAFDLALSLKLIRSGTYSETFPMYGASEDQYIFVSGCVATRLGRFFRCLPSFAKLSALWLILTTKKLSSTLNKFKWMTGFISFFVLSIKVWHSGLIDKTWIGISALAGFVAVWALSFLR